MRCVKFKGCKMLIIFLLAYMNGYIVNPICFNLKIGYVLLLVYGSLSKTFGMK